MRNLRRENIKAVKDTLREDLQGFEEGKELHKKLALEELVKEGERIVETNSNKKNILFYWNSDYMFIIRWSSGLSKFFCSQPKDKQQPRYGLRIH